MRAIFLGPWRLLRSRNVAVVLICLLIGLCVAGTAIPQKGDGTYDAWSRRSPGAAAFAGRLGLDDVFGSLPFEVLTATLALSMLACMVSRLHGLGSARPGDGVVAVLLFRRRLLGSLVFHAGMLATFVGAVVSSFTRIEGSVTVTEGQVIPLRAPGPPDAAGRGPGGPELFRIRLDRFHPIHETKWGDPDYASELTVIEDGRERKRATVMVNEPLKRRGIVLYQGTHGFSPRFVLTDRAGRTIFGSYVSLTTDLEADPVRYLDSFAIPGTGLVVEAEFFPDAVAEGTSIRTISPAPRNPAAAVTVRRGPDVIFSGHVFAGKPVEIEQGMRLSLEGVRYWSMLNVVRDRGAWSVFIGVWMVTAGLCLRFFRFGRGNPAGEVP